MSFGKDGAVGMGDMADGADKLLDKTWDGGHQRQTWNGGCC